VHILYIHQHFAASKGNAGVCLYEPLGKHVN